MKIISKLVIGLLLGATLLQGAAFDKVAKSRATNIQITSQKPLTTGNNTINFEIAQEKYKNSEVSIKVFMPAMPGMPYMESTSQVKKIGNGRYTTNLNLSMSGTWQVHIFLSPENGRKVRVKTSLTI